MSEFDKLYSELATEINEIERRFLSPYFPANPTHTPDFFEYDVKSCCILAHASFEEFLEMVSEAILSKLQAEFLSKKISLASAMLLLSYAGTNRQGNEETEPSSCFDFVRGALEDCRNKHSIALKDNHGFALKYMVKVLRPVGINAPKDDLKLDSVSKLASARGSFAHAKSKKAMYGEYKRATTSLSPEDARKIISDCLAICDSIRNSANNRW